MSATHPPHVNMVKVSFNLHPNNFNNQGHHIVKVQLCFAEDTPEDHSCHRLYKWKLKVRLNTAVSGYDLRVYKQYIEGVFEHAFNNRTNKGHLYWVSLAMNSFSLSTYFIDHDLLGFDHVLSIRFQEDTDM
ncbi:hypothetical protein PanWU01x14_080060 [Parasponia andersonii]|uniref:Uncharacterized protein n=1 Tax=Parasponia andersonii TaxID=3476 RepID=A0A2P5DBI2_PARAD|nr:hypothetical protein PanWU01x14_080060 [Parasponia andersonii]